MKKNYKNYDEEFKKTIVALSESGKAVSEIAREYDLERKSIYNWIKKYGTIITKSGLTTTNEEVNNLRKENMKLQQEVEILKKAMVIFTQK